MRLLNSSTLLLEEYFGHNVPEYVILSHTWEKDEVSFQDMERGTASSKRGFSKLKKCAEKAASDGFSYCWIDTCCIDKTSSAELSESINSMYRWYSESCICYALLTDFRPTRKFDRIDRAQFRRSRWWKRGWTLQELIAPAIVEFYDAEWRIYGTKLSLHGLVTEVTGIDQTILRGADPSTRTVAVRMSWAAERETTRTEDKAYCLLGLFGVNMPLLYGEAGRAFHRLQEEIMRIHEDYTLFVWSTPRSFDVIPHSVGGLFAWAPKYFDDSTNQSQGSWSSLDLSLNCWSVFPTPKGHEAPYMTGRGLHISLPMVETQDAPGEYYACVSLLRSGEREGAMVCISLIRRESNQFKSYYRSVGRGITILSPSEIYGFKYRSVYVAKQPEPPKPARLFRYDRPYTISLLLLQPLWIDKQPMRCYFSSWTCMDRVIAHMFPPEQEDDRLVSQSAMRDQAGSSRSSGALSYHSTMAMDLSEALRNLYVDPYRLRRRRYKKRSNACNLEELRNIALNYPPNQCWFPFLANSSAFYGDGVRGVLGFGNEQFPESAFVIQLGLFDDKAFCNVVPTTLTNMLEETCAQAFEEDVQPRLMQDDQVVFRLDLPQVADRIVEPTEVAVSIRCIATSPKGVKRYMLSVKHSIIAEVTDTESDLSFESEVDSVSSVSAAGNTEQGESQNHVGSDYEQQ